MGSSADTHAYYTSFVTSVLGILKRRASSVLTYVQDLVMGTHGLDLGMIEEVFGRV